MRPTSYLAESGNPPTPAWPGFKLAWIRDHDPEAYRRAAAVMMPKDYVNFRLTGEIAMEATEGVLQLPDEPGDAATGRRPMIALLGLDPAKLPRLRSPLEILGGVTEAAAVETGLLAGTPVLVGGADYPMALLGSGACRPGLVSDVTGTSSIITLITEAPLLDPEICNVATIEGDWGPFVLLESGGDAMRWARRAFHEGALGYPEIVAKAAEAAPGAGGLFFLPYLVGERLGAHRNARAQFFGLGAGARPGRAAPGGAGGRGLRRHPPHPGDGGGVGPAAGPADRLRRRRQDRAVAEDQGQRHRPADPGAGGGGMRRGRLRRHGRRRHRPLCQGAGRCRRRSCATAPRSRPTRTGPSATPGCSRCSTGCTTTARRCTTIWTVSRCSGPSHCLSRLRERSETRSGSG